jgi:tetratricopeptide (TPR) repeat protein
LRYFVRSFVFALALISIASGVVFGQSAPDTKAPESSATGEAAPSAQVAEAESLMGKSDWKTAEAKLTPWLADHPADARALFDAGYAADALGKGEEAAGFYRRAVAADPKRFEAHLSLGLLLARAGKLEEARGELQTATGLDAGDAGPGAKARAWRALAQIDRNGNPGEASNDLLEALKLSPETPDDTLLAAELAERSGQPDAAATAYRQLLSKDSGDVAANAGLAHILITRKEYADAEKLLRTALEKAPDDPAMNAQLAAALAAQNKAEAVPLLQKLHAAHPEDQTITRMLAEVLDEAGNTAEADQLYTALLKGHPDDADLLIAHGQNLTRQQRFVEALAVFSRTTDVDSANPDGWSGLAFAASKTGKPEVTLHALTMRSKYLPDIPSTYFLWATSYDTLHDKAAAITYYHHFLEAAAGKYPNQEWQARQRLLLLEKKQ